MPLTTMPTTREKPYTKKQKLGLLEKAKDFSSLHIEEEIAS
ncbi:hypothetical protein [Bartonella sp. A05]|nr:hypothetical protein [Bartonella sp. A05]MCZ2203689.1 hypothetical protein [Bartonella sp. A05]